MLTTQFNTRPTMTLELIDPTVTGPMPRDYLLALATDGCDSPHTRRNYAVAISDFLDWYEAAGHPVLNKATLSAYKQHLLEVVSPYTGKPLSASAINLRLIAVRRLINELADNGVIPQDVAASAVKVRGVAQRGVRMGNWLTKQQAQALLDAPDPNTLRGKRDRALFAILLGCALRREEVARLTIEHFQQREGRWVIVDLVGKRHKVRNIPVPAWVKARLDAWTGAAGITSGPLWFSFRKGDRLQRDTITAAGIWKIVTEYCQALGYPDVAPHDLRRTAAKLMRAGGASLEQISLTLGHEHLDVTKRYLGTELDLTHAATDAIDLH